MRLILFHLKGTNTTLLHNHVLSLQLTIYFIISNLPITPTPQQEKLIGPIWFILSDDASYNKYKVDV